MEAKAESFVDSLPLKYDNNILSSELIYIAFNEINNNIFITKTMELYGSYQDAIDNVINHPESLSDSPEYQEIRRLNDIKKNNPEIEPLITATMLYFYHTNIGGDDYPTEGEIIIQSESAQGKIKEEINYLAIAKFIIKKYSIITIGNRAFIFNNGYYYEEDKVIESEIQKILSGVTSTHTKPTDRITRDIYEKVLKFSLTDTKKLPFLKNSKIIPTKSEAIVRCKHKIVHIPKSPAIGKNWYVNAEYVDNLDTHEVWDFLVEVTNKSGKTIPDYAKVIVQIGSSALAQIKELQQAYMLYGNGSNAKSLIAALINKIIGSENVAHLKLQGYNRNFALSTLLGKMMNIYPEIPQNSLDSGSCSIFKTLTGTDELEFEKKFKEPINELPTLIMLFCANTLPDVPPDIESEAAWWRRWTIINCPNYYEQNMQFAQYITSQPIMNQLFKLMVDDISRLEQDGLYKSQNIDTTRELWRCGANNVFSFFIKNYEVTAEELPKEEWIPKTTIYNKYQNYCRAMDIDESQIKSAVVVHPVLTREKCKIKTVTNPKTNKQERYYTNLKPLNS